VQGHQGALFSDRFRKYPKWFVRHVWRPTRRFFRFKFNSVTPSNDFKLKEHEKAIYAWAVEDRGRVLIAGHIHHPVWGGEGFAQALDRLSMIANHW
jgi:hypothetical protein